MNISRRRIWGLILRHLYNFRHNYDRVTDVFYWPVMDVVLWGLTIAAITKTGKIPQNYIEMVLYGVILWLILWRSQSDISINCLEELWSENLGNLLGSPLTVFEWISGLMLIGFIKMSLGVIFVSIVTYLIYGVNFFSLGFAFIPFAAMLLVMGWTLGLLFSSLFFRFGTIAQTLAWSGGALVLPFSVPFYPVTVFSPILQKIISLVPSSYVFEAMRFKLATGQLPWEMFFKSLGLNLLYFGLVLFFFRRSFIRAKKLGLSRLK